MRVEFQRAGYKLESIVKGQFRNDQWVGESPLEADSAAGLSVSLTEAPRAIDQIRVKFTKQ